MSRAWLVIARKKFRDFANLKLLVAYFVPYVAVAWFMSLVLTGAVEKLGEQPLAAQEQFLTQQFVVMSFGWAVGIPFMILVGVLVANGLALEEQRGTLRILLSKPVPRREVVLGTGLAATAFGTVLGVTSILVAAVALFTNAGTVPASLERSIFALLPGLFVYAVVLAVLVTSVATALAVLTGSRLRTALGAATLPALFLAFIFVRALVGTNGVYSDYYLYVVDVSYHSGNLFVTLQDLFGVQFSPATQSVIGPLTGVYDASGWGVDPILNAQSGSVPLHGFVPQWASILLLGSAILGLLVASIQWFERKDVS